MVAWWRRYDEGASGAGVAGSTLALVESVREWLSELPTSLEVMERTGDLIKSPLFRCCDREVTGLSALLRHIRDDDLAEMVKVASGEVKSSNRLREVTSALSRDELPAAWTSVYSSEPMPVKAWLADLAQRAKQLATVVATPMADIGSMGLWLGGLSSPEAFITATRQEVARSRGWALEDLRLVVHLESVAPPNPDRADCSFVINGLVIEGASWDAQAGELALTSVVRTPLGPATFSWVPSAEAPVADAGADWRMVKLPVYLNASRKQLVLHVFLRAPARIPVSVWEQRAVCLLAWSQHFALEG